MHTFEKWIDREIGWLEMIGRAPFPNQFTFSVDLLYDVAVNGVGRPAGDKVGDVLRQRLGGAIEQVAIC